MNLILTLVVLSLRQYNCFRSVGYARNLIQALHSSVVDDYSEFGYNLFFVSFLK